MRPAILNPLFTEVASVKGIGDKLARLFAKLLRGDELQPARLVDVLFHLPTHVTDRRFRCSISQLPQSGIATLEVVIGKHKPPPRGTRLPYKIVVHDDTGQMSLVFFAAHGEQMLRQFPEGQRRLISGEVSWFGTEAQISHPDYVLRLEEADKMPDLEPVYPLTAGLSGKVFVKAVAAALEKIPYLDEWQDAAWIKSRSWIGFDAALHTQHVPVVAGEVSALTPNRMRLAYDELLANQLALTLVRKHMKRSKGRALGSNGKLRAAIIAGLPYSLTQAQQVSLGEIYADMAAPQRMIRLLQGDVGSGKTVVGLLALCTAVEAGAQGTIMAPTEILARQHFEGLSKLVGHTHLRVALLTGREKGKPREQVLAQLASGEIDILIGTHALFQEGVEFRDLGLVVIDEQHRFGVHQRLALQSKGGDVDLLVMTATPIPRTLALTVYGDMDVSRLTEKPAGRQPIDTRVMPMSRIDDVIAGLGRSMASGARAYWVCPLVEDSELVDLAAAQTRFEALTKIYPGKVGLVHGRMKGAEKDAVMAAFKSGALALLVATTVIEVGVDVPEASIMVIENAERYGLAQLHQLRGRVGRGAAKSSCILLYQEPLGEVARERLSTMRETEDGFLIAEVDLKLRGAGEMLGTAQSGLPLFRLADLTQHADLLVVAHDDAELIMATDAGLTSARGLALRQLLYLFERESAVRLLSSG